MDVAYVGWIYSMVMVTGMAVRAVVGVSAVAPRAVSGHGEIVGVCGRGVGGVCGRGVGGV